MSKPIHIDWIAKNALDGTMQLGPWEELAYRRILDMIYASDDNLLDDDESLRWSTKVGMKWPKVKQRLLAMKKIEVVEGRITNPICREKLSEAHVRIKAGSIGGRASAEARKLQKYNDTTSTVVCAGVSTDESTNRQPITNYQVVSSESKDSSDIPPIEKSDEKDFDKFCWQPWPPERRKERLIALAEWRRACKKMPMEVVAEAIRKYLASDAVKPNFRGEIFVPYPGRWLKKQLYDSLGLEAEKSAGTNQLVTKEQYENVKRIIGGVTDKRALHNIMARYEQQQRDQNSTQTAKAASATGK